MSTETTHSYDVCHQLYLYLPTATGQGLMVVLSIQNVNTRTAHSPHEQLNTQYTLSNTVRTDHMDLEAKCSLKYSCYPHPDTLQSFPQV